MILVVLFVIAITKEKNEAYLAAKIRRKKGDKNEINTETGVCFDYGNTAENLASAAGGENYEANVMYPEFADVAEEEGYKLGNDVHILRNGQAQVFNR